MVSPELVKRLKGAKFVNLKQVKERTTLSHSSIYRLMAKNKFPHSINLIGRRIAWIESEVQEWIDDKIAEGPHGEIG